MGCCADLGWAWNVKPGSDVVGKWKARVPSGEFTESFVIWLYGASNMFLEHLAGWGKEWTARDLEHVSISIMFFGGGLVSTPGLVADGSTDALAVRHALRKQDHSELAEQHYSPIPQPFRGPQHNGLALGGPQHSARLPQPDARAGDPSPGHDDGIPPPG